MAVPVSASPAQGDLVVVGAMAMLGLGLMRRARMRSVLLLGSPGRGRPVGPWLSRCSARGGRRARQLEDEAPLVLALPGGADRVQGALLTVPAVAHRAGALGQSPLAVADVRVVRHFLPPFVQSCTIAAYPEVLDSRRPAMVAPPGNAKAAGRPRQKETEMCEWLFGKILAGKRTIDTNGHYVFRRFSPQRLSGKESL